MKGLPPKRVRAYYLYILIIGAVLGGIGAVNGSIPLAAAGIVILLGDIIFQGLCHRCPHCGRYLDRSGGDFCPYCGRSIDK